MWSQPSFPPLKRLEKMTVFTNMFSDSGIAFGIHKGMLNFHVIVLEKWAMNLWVPHVKTVSLADIFLSLLWTELSRPGPSMWISSNDKSHFAAGCCYCTVAHLCLTLCHPMDCSTSGFPVHHHLLEFAQTHVHWVGGAIQPFHPLSVFPSIRVFSSELALFIRWPKYWSFSFSISPSNEYSGLISFRID